MDELEVNKTLEKILEAETRNTALLQTILKALATIAGKQNNPNITEEEVREILRNFEKFANNEFSERLDLVKYLLKK